MSIYTWSEIALDNENADPNINWTEGQNSNTVNNSARAMMAAIAALIKVISGQATSGGATNAYTLTSPSGHAFTSYVTGMMVCFKANHDNTGAATLNVDALGAKSLRKFGSTNVVAGDIENGNLIFAIYDGTNFQVLNYVANNNIQAFSGLTSAANKLPYFDGAGSMTVADLSAFGRTLIDDADAATARGTLNAAALTGGNTFTGKQLFENGSAVAPSIAFSSEPDCGLYYISAGVIGVSINGSKVFEWDANAARVTGVLSVTGNPSAGSHVGDRDYNDARYLLESNNLSDLPNAATARSNLGLGSLATLSSVSNSNWSGTDLAVANGGTGASNASGARSNLGIPENTRSITFGTGAPPALGTGEVYLRHN